MSDVVVSEAVFRYTATRHMTISSMTWRGETLGVIHRKEFPPITLAIGDMLEIKYDPPGKVISIDGPSGGILFYDSGYTSEVPQVPVLSIRDMIYGD